MQNVLAFEFSALSSPVHAWLRAVQLGVWAAASPAEEADASWASVSSQPPSSKHLII